MGKVPVRVPVWTLTSDPPLIPGWTFKIVCANIESFNPKMRSIYRPCAGYLLIQATDFMAAAEPGKRSAAPPAPAAGGGGGAEWKVGLFSCFSDCSLCVCAYFFPCYVVGRNAQEVNCVTLG